MDCKLVNAILDGGHCIAPGINSKAEAIEDAKKCYECAVGLAERLVWKRRIEILLSNH